MLLDWKVIKAIRTSFMFFGGEMGSLVLALVWYLYTYMFYCCLWSWDEFFLGSESANWVFEHIETLAPLRPEDDGTIDQWQTKDLLVARIWKGSYFLPF